VVCRDVSEHKRDQAELARQAEELAAAREHAENATRFNSRFLSSMSHELRTPLNAIIGFSELLEEQVSGALTPTQAEYVAYVLSSGRHLLHLVNDVLDLSTAQTGGMSLDRAWTAPEVIVDSLRDVVDSLAGKQGVTLELELPLDLPDIHVDPLRMRQVLYNLLSNGIKFTPRGGRVRLSVRAHERELVLSVADTGVGIRGEDLPRLFGELEQLGAGPDPRPEGSGLGLALTKKLVELHGGAISVESEHGRGSTFTFTVPLEGPSA
jgi:Amt family ammonium transporter